MINNNSSDLHRAKMDSVFHVSVNSMPEKNISLAVKPTETPSVSESFFAKLVQIMSQQGFKNS